MARLESTALIVGAPETTPVFRVASRTWVARIIALPLCVAVMVVHLVGGHDDFPTMARVYAGALACIALLCVVYAPIRVVPAIAIGLTYFYAALGIPVFSKGTTFSLGGPIRLPAHALEEASFAALMFASIVLLVGWFVDRLTRRVAWNAASWLEGGSVYESRHTVAARVVAFASLAFAFANNLGVTFGSFAQPAGLFAAPVISITLLFWDAELTKSSLSRQLFWSVVGVHVFFGLVSGMMGTALRPAVVAAALLWARRGRVPMGLAVTGIVLFLIFNPAKGTYRTLTWFGAENSTLGRVGRWGDALWYTYMEGRNEEMEELSSGLESSLSRAALRLNTLGQVAQIFDWVPERVPYAGADRWVAAPGLLVPRALWPEKPMQEEFFNKNYTFAFRLQTPRAAANTSITLPSVGDGYWRLGWPGVALEAMFLGIFLGMAQSIGRGGVSRISSRTSLLLGISLMQIHTDLHTFGLMNGALQALLVAAVVAWSCKILADLLVTEAPALIAARGTRAETD